MRFFPVFLVYTRYYWITRLVFVFLNLFRRRTFSSLSIGNKHAYTENTRKVDNFIWKRSKKKKKFDSPLPALSEKKKIENTPLIARRLFKRRFRVRSVAL